MAKETVENSWVLDAVALVREGGLRDGTRGTCPCTQGGKTAHIRWAFEEDENHDEFLHLLYSYTARDGSETDRSDWILLERTRTPVGGERIWFTCPKCERRVRKLYLPPSGGQFLCRVCHRLSYQSRQWRMRSWDPVRKLEKQRHASPADTKRWLREERELERVEASLPSVQWKMPSWANLYRPYVKPPKRRPGRPSKRAERERAQAEREAAKEPVVKRPPGRPKVKRPYTRRKPLLLSESKSDTEAYCVKCRDRREIPDPQPVALSNGRPALKGTCPVCATLLTRIVKAGEDTAGRSAAPAAPVKRPRGRPRVKRPYSRPKPLLESEGKRDTEGYCVKCWDVREITDPQRVTLSNGRPALKGTCPLCGARMTRIVKAEKTDQG